ncbi:MAG: hypothetical protein COB76_04880 [Alphaproteobacteria bacterium]|nr:MAG: hypothetical protein COB76_04880 [Alphaproteobacteria bacterium]
MDLSFFTQAKTFFDFGLNQSFDGLPPVLQNIITHTGSENLTALFAALWRDIDPAWDINLCDLSGHGYDMDVDQKILSIDSKGLLPDQALSSSYFAPQILLSLIEGIRMVRHVEWLDNALERYHPESIVKIGRICVADSVSQTISVAWHGRGQGCDAMWKHLLCGMHSDMAQCFDRVMERGLSQGGDESDVLTEALEMTFRTWFTDEDRVVRCDHDSLNVMDELLNDEIEIGFKHIEQASIVCLTLQVGGNVTYLCRDVLRDMMRNPFYGAIDSLINQTHLMQIIRDTKINEVAGIPFRDIDLASRFMMID